MQKTTLGLSRQKQQKFGETTPEVYSVASFIARLNYKIYPSITSDMTIKNISYKLNFESTSMFSTFFRKKEGIPPLAYRKEGRDIQK